MQVIVVLVELGYLPLEVALRCLALKTNLHTPDMLRGSTVTADGLLQVGERLLACRAVQLARRNLQRLVRELLDTRGGAHLRFPRRSSRLLSTTRSFRSLSLRLPLPFMCRQVWKV